MSYLVGRGKILFDKEADQECHGHERDTAEDAAHLRAGLGAIEYKPPEGVQPNRHRHHRDEGGDECHGDAQIEIGTDQHCP